MAEKVTGPKSYFPSIEKKYGRPIDYWMTQLDATKDAKHMEQVAHLKELGTATATPMLSSRSIGQTTARSRRGT
jgi:hypothetical protein